MKEFPCQVRQLRLERHLTQYRLGQLSGSDGKHIGRIERGQKLPKVDLLLRIARALGVPPCQLYPAVPCSEHDAANPPRP